MEWKTIIERRSTTGAWAYVTCAVVAVCLASVSLGMEGEYVVLIPYLAIIALCVVQLFRPTLLGWFLLFAPFATYTVGIIYNFQPPIEEYLFFIGLLGFPTLALLVSRPRPFLPSSKAEILQANT